MGDKEFDQLNCIIIDKAEEIEQGGKRPASPKKSQPGTETKEEEVKNEEEQQEPKQETPAEIEVTEQTHMGKLKLDATVADQMIQYPTDLGLLSTAREESQRLIDELHQVVGVGKKPRTYRKKARKQYLRVAKKKKKSKKEIRKAIGQQLRYLRRNLKSIHKQLDQLQQREQHDWPLHHRDQKIFWVIQHIYAQQMEMYLSNVHSTANRIVNIYQPHVRPIVRGKEKAAVEFGAKLGVSLQNGFARINTFNWEAYNESTDLKKQVNDYRTQNGYYPEVVLTDTIYGTKQNRDFLKQLGIRFAGKQLGRPPKEELTYYEKRKRQKERNERNHIEGKFGQGKNGYGLNKIRARQQKTSESWVSCIFFVMNILALIKKRGKKGKDFLFSIFIYPSTALYTAQNAVKELVSEITQAKFKLKPVEMDYS